jgi:hypothetical protein
MNKEAYEIGVAFALKEAGIAETAQNVLRHLSHDGFHPGLPLAGAAIGGTAGALTADEDESALLRAIVGGGIGAMGGLGIGGLRGYRAELARQKSLDLWRSGLSSRRRLADVEESAKRGIELAKKRSADPLQGPTWPVDPNDFPWGT